MTGIMDDPRWGIYQNKSASTRLLCPRCPKVGRTGTEQKLKEPGGGYCKECRKEYQRERNVQIRKELRTAEEALAVERSMPVILELAYAEKDRIEADDAERAHLEKQYYARFDAAFGTVNGESIK